MGDHDVAVYWPTQWHPAVRPPSCCIGLRLSHEKRAANFTLKSGPGGTTVSRAELACSATIEGRFDVLLRILADESSIDEAIAQRLIKTQGSTRTLRKLPSLFDLSGRRTPAWSSIA
jgi:hypothetical protein